MGLVELLVAEGYGAAAPMPGRPIPTSDFAKEAENYVRRIHSKIVRIEAGCWRR